MLMGYFRGSIKQWCDITNNMSEDIRKISRVYCCQLRFIVQVHQQVELKKVLTNDVWSVLEVADNVYGVIEVLFNQAQSTDSIKIEFDKSRIIGTQSVRDLINQVDLRYSSTSFTCQVPAHAKLRSNSEFFHTEQ